MYICSVKRVEDMTKFITETSKDYSIVDNHTGELLELRQTRKLSLEEFIMVFFSSYPELFKLRGLQLKVLMGAEMDLPVTASISVRSVAA